MTRKLDTELYIGVVVWLVTISIAYSFWVSGDSTIIAERSTLNLVATAFFFCVYLVGYFLSYGVSGVKQGKRKKIIGLLVSGTATTILSVFYLFYGMMGCMAVMLIIQLAPLVKREWAIVVAIAVPAAFVLIDSWLSKDVDFTEAAVFGIMNVLALTMSYRAIAEHQAKLASEQLVRELKATQILLSATTKRDERLRIARNLHDIMGHQLTALNLQLEVASHVESDVKMEHINNAKKIGTSLLSNVRETVSEFRGEKNLKLNDALSALVEGIPNIEIKLDVDWDESLVNERQVEVIFRCAQEALTNVAKHSNATHCDIKVSSDDQNLALVVKNNGSGPAEIQPGNGLKGMAERVGKIDGDLHFENSTDEFVLSVKLPISDT